MLSICGNKDGPVPYPFGACESCVIIFGLVKVILLRFTSTVRLGEMEDMFMHVPFFRMKILIDIRLQN